MRRIGKGLAILPCMVGLIACGDDSDYVYPSVLTVFAEVHTNAEGVTDQLITDDGKTWVIPSSRSLSDLTPDSTYRMVATYEPQDEEVKLYVLQKAVSPNPKLRDDFEEVYTDPVMLTSIWRGGNYLNLVVKVKAKDQSHTYHFIDNGVTTDSVDRRYLDLRLYHNSHNDTEAFTRTVYLSVPLQGYADTLRLGDSIRFSLSTYDKDLTVRTFAWE